MSQAPILKIFCGVLIYKNCSTRGLKMIILGLAIAGKQGRDLGV